MGVVQIKFAVHCIKFFYIGHFIGKLYAVVRLLGRRVHTLATNGRPPCTPRRHYSLVFTKNIPKKWYKDQGGRDNHMELQLELRDANGHPGTCTLLLVSAYRPSCMCVCCEVRCVRKTGIAIKLLYKKNSSDELEELPPKHQVWLGLVECGAIAASVQVRGPC